MIAVCAAARNHKEEWLSINAALRTICCLREAMSVHRSKRPYQMDA